MKTNFMIKYNVTVQIDTDVAHGGWSTWTTFTQCSRTCNGGSQRRRRTCTNPSPMKGGQLCLNSEGKPASNEVHLKLCNTNICSRELQTSSRIVFFSFLYSNKLALCT